MLFQDFFLLVIAYLFTRFFFLTRFPFLLIQLGTVFSMIFFVFLLLLSHNSVTCDLFNCLLGIYILTKFHFSFEYGTNGVDEKNEDTRRRFDGVGSVWKGEIMANTI